MEKFLVRVNQEAGSPPPVVGGYVNWGVLLPDMLVIEVSPVWQTKVHEQTFDNYNLKVQAEVPDSNQFKETLRMGRMGVAIGALEARKEKQEIYEENIRRAKQGLKPLRWGVETSK